MRFRRWQGCSDSTKASAMINLALPLLSVFIPLLNFVLMLTFSNTTRS